MKCFYSIFTFLIFLSYGCFSQVKTEYNNSGISKAGIFQKDYSPKYINLTPPDEKVYKAKLREDSLSKDVRPFRIAEPVSCDIDLVKQGSWIEDGDKSYMRLTIRSEKAKSLSINFNKFYLPKESQMYIYSEDGRTVTGPVTSSENNDSEAWGSSIYKGESLIVEIQVNSNLRSNTKLVVSNVAYGIQEIYGFGNSSPCNINVLCPAGNGWDQERRSVALILNQDGAVWCSGALVNNTCNNNVAYFLTANHCLNNGSQNVGNWRFIFQYWSPSCDPSQDNFSSLLFNGSTLRANHAGSDFALLQLNQLPPSNSGITYAGWNRSGGGIQQTTIIHHPAGDVMKISRDNDAPSSGTVNGAQCWQLGLDDGATNGGSSGAPYFSQNHAIIAQHFGTFVDASNECDNRRKYGGRFDISWTGGGTNSTRLSNWLDPTNSGILFTSTTNSPAYFSNPPTPSINIVGVSPYGAVDAQASNYNYGTYNWYRDGSFVQSGGSSYQTLPGGNCGQSHYYQVSISNYCGATSPLSSNAYYQYRCQYRVYPNPAKEYISVEFEPESIQERENLPDYIDLLSESSSIPVQSIDVRKAFDSKSLENGNTIKLNVKELPRGVYYIYIKNQRNEEKPVESIRILIE